MPHPRAAERAFVLQPWAWMDPAATLNGVPVADLAAPAADLDLATFTASEPTVRGRPGVPVRWRAVKLTNPCSC